MDTKTLFDGFINTTWNFSRTVTGLYSGERVNRTAAGEASFSSIENGEPGLLYREEGVLESVSPKLHQKIFREYIYRYHQDKDELALYFVDDVGQEKKGERLFHVVHFKTNAMSNPTIIEGAGEHPCDEDHYHVNYKFSVDGPSITTFEIVYLVKGPTKDYQSITVYKPV